MGDPTGTVVSAVGLFAATNVDDLVIVTVLFLTANSRRGEAGIGGPRRPDANGLRVWHVWVGQYVGIAVLVLASVGVAAGLRLVPDRWIGLLGLVPFGLGLYALVRTIRNGDDGRPPAPARGIASVAALTVANGGDNVAVYAPVFRAIGWSGTVVSIVVFAAGVAGLCAVGMWLASRRPIVATLERWGNWIVPIVFMAIGVAIFLDTLP